MSRNNATNAVLVADNNVAVLAKDNTVDALAVGQLGIFDANTQLSVDATSNSPREFFLAVGLDRDGDATQDDINVSAGQYIQRGGVVTYNFREHTAAQPMIVEVADYLAECDTTYALKVEFRNQQIYRTQGHNQFTKTYAIKTDCCDTCETCYSADANEITLKMVAEINLDESQLVTAKAVTRQAVTIVTHSTSADLAEGDDISDADIAALIAFNALSTTADEDKVYTDIVLTTNSLAINSFCSVNLKYFNPRGTVIITSLVDGFNCNATVTTLQEIAFEEGNGYDIIQKEYHAAGNAQNQPYVASDSTGVPIEFDTFADKNEKYDQFTLEWDFSSQMEGTPYLNQLMTIIAVPNGNTTARNSIAAVLDKILTGTVANGFDPLADDVAAANTGDTVVSSTADIDDVTLDGQA